MKDHPEIKRLESILLNEDENEQMVDGKDYFLVGKGNIPSRMDPSNMVSSISHKMDGRSYVDEVEDDLGSFSEVPINISDRNEYVSLFTEYRNKTFDVFDFLAIKSFMNPDMVMNEKDLLIGDDEDYLINYLISHDVKSVHTIRCIAIISAYMNMEIGVARFISMEDCPICGSNDGMILTVDKIYNELCSGGYLVHPGEVFGLFPVINRSSYQGPLVGKLDKNVVTKSSKKVINMPVESVSKENLEMLDSLDVNSIKFTDMRNFYLNESGKVLEDNHEIVVMKSDDTLVVHNDYMGNSGPMDFVSAYISESKVVREAPEEADRKEVFYINGRKVFSHDGRYWDYESGALVK